MVVVRVGRGGRERGGKERKRVIVRGRKKKRERPRQKITFPPSRK